MDCSQYDALYLLWRLYLHMRAWGTPAYSQLREPDRTDFTEAVAAGELLETVENAKRLLLQTGFPAPDSWLAVLAAAPIDRGERLSQADRDELGEILNEILPHIIRAEVAGTKAPAPAAVEADALAFAFRVAGSDNAVLKIAHDTSKSADDRLHSLYLYDNRYVQWKSPALSKLLQVSAPAIRKCRSWKAAQWWKSHPDETLYKVLTEYEAVAE